MPTTTPVNRTLVGLLALVGVVGGGLVLALQSAESQFGASLLRTGVLLGALWIALPTNRRAAAWADLSPWTVLALAGLCLIAGRHKYAFIGGIVLMVIVSIFLRPRRRS